MQEQAEEEEEIERGRRVAFFKGIINSLNALVTQYSCYVLFNNGYNLAPVLKASRSCLVLDLTGLFIILHVVCV